MSEAKHTAGPWRDVKHSTRSGAWIIEILEPNGLCFEIMRVCEDEEDYNELVANARLIAAAPEMLEALQAIHRALGRNDFFGTLVAHCGGQLEASQKQNDLIVQAEAAIRKAEGV